MVPPPSQIEPVTADDVLTVQFTHIKRGGYDTQEVDAFLDRIAVTLDAEGDQGMARGMRADDVRTAQFGHAKRGGYDTGEVDNFLDRIVEVFTGSGAAVAEPEPEPEPVVEPSKLDHPPDPFGLAEPSVQIDADPEPPEPDPLDAAARADVIADLAPSDPVDEPE